VVDKTVGALIEADKQNGQSSSAIQGKVAIPRGERPHALEYDESSLIYPFNSLAMEPLLYLDRPATDVPFAATKFQRLLVPSVMPKGLDPYLLVEEHERYIQGRMNWRQRELEEMLITGGSIHGAKPVPGLTDDSSKPMELKSSAQIRAAIELRGLRLRDKQKLLREDMLRDVNAATRLPSERTDFRRMRTFTLRSAKETEDAEKRQRLERERQSKDKHLQYVKGICDHGIALAETARRSNEKSKRLGLAVMRMHKDTEREEQKRLEKLAKERLKALKNDDEDSYRALIDQAKDTRITHLLKRTDAYLDSLANQVRLQQEDVKTGGQPRNRNMDLPVDGSAGGADDTKGDYLAMTHMIKETVTKQADLLVGGTLKVYQVAGLEWMVSLYNNKLNGILADEMVSITAVWSSLTRMH
jgi:ATP-dependent helicase STH1/SNF2